MVWGKTLAKHNDNKRLNKAFLKSRKSGLKLNKKECRIGVKSIIFLRHVIPSEGGKVDPAKPNSVNYSYPGMITYLGKFIPNLAEVTSPFRTLLKKEVEFKLEKTRLDLLES